MLPALQICRAEICAGCGSVIGDRRSDTFLLDSAPGFFTTPVWPPLPSVSTGVTFYLRKALQEGK